MSVICTEAVLNPAADGVKLAVIVQLAFLPKCLPQLFAWEKFVGFVPIRAMLDMFTGPVPTFVMVTNFDAEVVPTVWLPKAREAGLKTSVRVIPVPLKVTTCGEFGPLSVKERVPDAGMAVCGVKVTLTEQDVLVASVEPQVFALIAK